MSARHWLAGLTECLALVVDHLGQGLSALAEHLDPRPAWCDHTLADGSRHLYPLADAIPHEPTDGCACGPTVKLDHDEGDTWVYRHHPLTQPDDLPRETT
jgi:hypothetical protein